MKIKYLHPLILSLSLSLVACGGGDNNSAEATNSETQDVGGFVASRLPDDMKAKNTVFIFAPQHCPKAAGQRADALERRLKSQGLKVKRKSQFRYEAYNLSQKEMDEMDKTMKIMNGEVPVVFVNEYGKANPSADEVLAVYEATQ
ncbi:MAG: hypothetical protein CR974_00360 [Gammaproteobacteria bacterium]|nr:MAG: hypothetical protein CR974_00360 [Gammaproteobacteria bacterium]